MRLKYQYNSTGLFASDSTILPNSNVSIDVFDNTDESALIKVQVGKDSDEYTIFFPEQKHIESNIKIDGSFRSDILNLTVADGESSDTADIYIPTSNNGGGGGGAQHIPSNLIGTANYRENKLTISIADGESQTAFQTEIETTDKETKKKIAIIYNILGRGNWNIAKDNTVSLPVKPEELIKQVGSVLYQDNNDSLTKLTVTNLLELLTAFSTVDFYRSGYHRLPATMFTSFLNTEAGNVPLKLYDALSMQE